MAAAVDMLAPAARQLYGKLAGAPSANAGCFHFEVQHESRLSGARAGVLHTPHGAVPTPSFVAVATLGALKCVDVATLPLPHTPLVFCNTFHLLCSSLGPRAIESLGGLHELMGLPRGGAALITDSGGFQVFSLGNDSSPASSSSSSSSSARVDMLKGQRGANAAYRPDKLLLRVSDEGALFRSPYSGERIMLTPELSIATQKQLGADFIVVLDELPPLDTPPERLQASLARTHAWELRSLAAHFADPRQQAIYGIVHGGADRALRRQSADFVASLPFDGVAVGGSIGGTRDEMLALLADLLPGLRAHQQAAGRPRHLLGIGDPYSIDKAVRLGLDTFDSVYPTRAARHGMLYKLARAPAPLAVEPVPIRKRAYAEQKQPVDPDCSCATCTSHSAAYLHHLCRAREPLLGYLATIHNLHVWFEYMTTIRQLILNDKI